MESVDQMEALRPIQRWSRGPGGPGEAPQQMSSHVIRSRIPHPLRECRHA